MAGLSKKQLEIRNLTLTDYIKAAIRLLDDQTMDGVYTDRKVENPIC